MTNRMAEILEAFLWVSAGICLEMWEGARHVWKSLLA